MLLPSPLEKLQHPLFEEKKLQVYVKRDDLIDPVISGNKWRKLKYNLEKARQQETPVILTFGGAYSNHISATARAGKLLGFETIGVIRGEEILPLNPTLQQATEDGMQLHFVSRSDYRKKEEELFLAELKKQFGDFYLIPEGGGNAEGVKGCAEIVTEISDDFDFIMTDCGTGATLAGIVSELKKEQKAIGIPVLKGGEFIREEVKKYIGEEALAKFELHTKYHFGGYAKYSQELIDFMRDFYRQTGIKTDPVYTGKLFFSLMDLVRNDYFPKGSSLIVVHTGGLQGITGFEERNRLKIY